MPKRILVIDDTEFWRELAADVLRSKGYYVDTATDGIQAMEKLGVDGADLIILDLEMPHMNGFDFLGQIRRQEKWTSIPVIMLTGAMDRLQVLRARQLGAVEYLLKACFSLDELIARVEKRLKGSTPSTTETPAAAENQRTDTLVNVEELSRLKALIGTVSAVHQLVHSPGASVKELAEAICRDAVLSARVLQMANSTAYATNNLPVVSLEEGVKRLGMKAVANLAVSAGVFDAFHLPHKMSAVLLRCWQHAYAVAEIMAMLAVRGNGIEPAAAYLIGLCHDLDEIFLRQRFGSQYAGAEEQAARQNEPVWRVLARTFEVSRTDLVAEIMSMLHMPRAVAAPIEEYAKAQSHGDHAGMSAVACMLRVADMYATGLLLAPSVQAAVAPVTVADCRVMAIADGPLDIAGLRSRVVAAIALLAKIDGAGPEELSRPLLEPKAKTVWYVRHRSMATLDPLRVALGSLFEVVDRSWLPRQSSDLIGVNAIVAVSPRSDIPGLSLADANNVLRWASPQMPLDLLYVTAPETERPLGESPQVHWPVSLSRLANLIVSANAVAA